MPTQFVVNKWICDVCPHMLDTELDCILHERDMHYKNVPKPQDHVDDIEILEDMCKRLTGGTTRAKDDWKQFAE
jgi:hypothetical protein